MNVPVVIDCVASVAFIFTYTSQVLKILKFTKHRRLSFHSLFLFIEIIDWIETSHTEQASSFHPT